MYTVYFRFYEELNDFLPDVRKKNRFEHQFIDKASVKDMIESLGVPHTEIDMILVNSKPEGFAYHVKDGDEISVYPVFESFDVSAVQHLRAKPLRSPKFVLDVHLGTLARYMRMAGFDTLYENYYEDEEIVNISLTEKRTILTKDRGILKRKEVTHGYFVRNIYPERQLEEVVNRFDLKNIINEFSRCLECNEVLKKVEKSDVLNMLPAKVKERHDKFYMCPKCNKVFWKGSHYNKMELMINKIKKS